MKKKILIAGGGGMLGLAFHEIFSKSYDIMSTDIDLNEDWLSYLDIRDYEQYHNIANEFKPDYIFHLGALTNLEECELNIDNAYMTNTIGVENATYIANKLNVPIVYIGTAGIFDGKKDVYDDWDKPNPLGHYARSKYLGEEIVKKNTKNHIICRAGWMMGGGPRKDKKFINKIIMQINEGNKTLNIVNDKFGTPTFTNDFAKNIKLLLEKEYWGTYNLVCNGLTNRLDVTKEILKNFNLQDKIKINIVNSEFFSKDYFAPRPYSERLINYKLNLRNLNIMRDWKISLSEYLKSYDFIK